MRYVGLLVLALALPAIAYALAGQASLININTANATLLDTLPGIGPSKAAAIVDYRTQNGPFAVIEDIQKVSGIGPVTFANMKDIITVDATSAPARQPSVPQASSNKVQKVEPITSTGTNVQTHEEEVRAPAVATELVAAGAALPAPATKPRLSGLFSLWTLGLLGVIIVAGVAFIFL